jgi:hypothetical protein
MRYFGLGPNRFICDVFDEMRKAHDTRNYSYLLSLIEEAQVLANRMEAGLSDKNDIKEAQKYKKELKAEIEELKAKKEKLENEK